MDVQIKIDTASRQEAEIVASALPGKPAVLAARGYGLVQLRCKKRDLQSVVERVAAAAHENGITWVRVRPGDDDEYVFRNGVLRRTW
jgi:hypothetical protein